MLYTTLSFFLQQLNDFLKLRFKLREDIAVFAPLQNDKGTSASNKLCLSLINIERETAAGIRFNRQAVSSSTSKQSAPSWLINTYFLVSAVFSEKQYVESLQLISGVLFFLQNNNIFVWSETGTSFAVEPVNLSFHEQSNVWGICGGTYYPSILCKLRVLAVNGNEFTDLSTLSAGQDIGYGKQ